MSGEYPLRTIESAYVDRAVEKAAHYRLLNWPEEAESICLDVLAVRPDHPQALEILVLALTDQFAASGKASRIQQARDVAAKMADPYERVYLEGIIHEREGRAHLARGLHGGFAYECFREAMVCYERALALAPAENQEAALRYNSCVRTIERERLQARADEGEIQLE